MAKGNHLNALLMEILMAVLFFALSATVILNGFVAAHSQSERAETLAAALTDAQNLAEALYALGPDGQWLAAEGFVQSDGRWTRDAGGYELIAELGGEGGLFSANVSAVCGGETLVSLPCAKYIPAEVSE